MRENRRKQENRKCLPHSKGASHPSSPVARIPSLRWAFLLGASLRNCLNSHPPIVKRFVGVCANVSVRKSFSINFEYNHSFIGNNFRDCLPDFICHFLVNNNLDSVVLFKYCHSKYAKFSEFIRT